MNYIDDDQDQIPDELVGMIPLGDGGLLEVPYRHHFELKHLKRIVKFTRDMNVLELGCGNGRWIKSLCPIVNHYTGVDFSKKALDIAAKSVMWSGNVTLYNQSVVDFWCRRTRMFYDMVYFSGVSQYIEDNQIHHVINNLEDCIKPSTIIIDRSTINVMQREVIQTEKYYSIYRTSQELKDIYGEHGFKCTYQAPSYRYLRGKPSKSIYVMMCKSYIMDTILPVERSWSHDFFIFEQISDRASVRCCHD